MRPKTRNASEGNFVVCHTDKNANATWEQISFKDKNKPGNCAASSTLHWKYMRTVVPPRQAELHQVIQFCFDHKKNKHLLCSNASSIALGMLVYFLAQIEISQQELARWWMNSNQIVYSLYSHIEPSSSAKVFKV